MMPHARPAKKHEETVVIIKSAHSDAAMATSIEKITKVMDLTLTLDQIKKTPVLSTKPPVESVICKTMLAAIEEKFNTPVKSSLVTERVNTPATVITEKLIISPIKSAIAERIEDGDADSNYLESVHYYREMVVEKTKQLNDLSNKWNIITKETIDPPLSDDNQGKHLIFF
jgi:hypothetical protein